MALIPSLGGICPPWSLDYSEYNIHQPEEEADSPHTSQSLTLPRTTDKHTQSTTENSKRMKDVSTSNVSHFSRKP